MRALDSNVLVRSLVRDDEAQYSAAARTVRQAVERGESLFVADAVLCEVWCAGCSVGGTARTAPPSSAYWAASCAQGT